MGLVEGSVADLGQDIIGLQAGLGSGAIGDDIGDVNTPVYRQVISAGYPGRDGLVTDAQIRAGKITLLHNLLSDGASGIDRNSESQALGDGAGVASAHDQGIDPDHLSSQVDQRTARVPLVDGRIGLDHALDQVTTPAVDGATGGADNTNGDGVLEVAQRRANSHSG